MRESGRMTEKASGKKERENRHVMLFAIVFGAALAVLIVFFAVRQSGVQAKDGTAITIDGKDYPLCEFNYFYYSYYNTFCSENAQYLSYMFDETKSLKDQKYDDQQSWFDYFEGQAAESMTGIKAACAEAGKAGVSLSEESRSAVGTALENLETTAANADKTTDAYLSAVYGNGMTEKIFEQDLSETYLAKEYSEKVKADFTFTDAELEKEYKDNLPSYTTVSYERFYAKAADMGTKATEEQRASAKETADAVLAAVQSGTALKDAAAPYSSKGAYNSFADAAYDKSYSYGDWLFSADRKDGDSTEIDDGNGYYVMVFHDSEKGEYKSADVIDVLFPVSTDSIDSSASDAADQKNQLYEDSCEAAEKLQSDFGKTDGSKDAFEKLAAPYADNSDTDGTLMNLTKGKMGDKADAWIFAGDRKTGDCEVFYTESGFHTVYYLGAGTEAWKAEAEENLRDAAYDKWYRDLIGSVSVTRHEDILGSAGGQ
jgi:hypothetical protein